MSLFARRKIFDCEMKLLFQNKQAKLFTCATIRFFRRKSTVCRCAKKDCFPFHFRRSEGIGSAMHLIMYISLSVELLELIVPPYVIKGSLAKTGRLAVGQFICFG